MPKTKDNNMRIRLIFEENGGEYAGTLLINCSTFNQLNSKTFEVNGAKIEIDEEIECYEVLDDAKDKG